MSKLWPTKEEWDAYKTKDRIATIAGYVAIITAIGAGITKSVDLLLTDLKTIKIPLVTERVHLGDYIFAKVGGVTIAEIHDPLSKKYENTFVVYYDKEKNSFQTSWGYPTHLQLLSSLYGSEFSQTNLKAWRHVLARSPDPTDPVRYKGDRVNVPGLPELVWREGKGNFYSNLAPIGVTVTINLYRELQRKSIDPDALEIRAAVVWLTGFHGGRRRDQSDNVDLVVNNRKFPIAWEKPETRNTERRAIDIAEKELKLGSSDNTTFTILVLPYEEALPLPPPESSHPKRGPAHFRDIEIWDIELELHLE